MDDTEGMTDSAPEMDAQTTQDAAPQASAGAVAPAAQAAAPAPQQPQGPDWNSLGVPFDQAQQQIQYYKQLEERYKSDPAWQQKYDQLWQGQQQQQQHPLSWAKYDDNQQKALREAIKNGTMEDPQAARHSAFMNDFYHNPIGTLPQMLTHPDVMGPLYEAMAPQVQDMLQRAMQQQMAPMQQFMQQQAEQQFRAQHEKAFNALPQQIKELHRAGRFGQGPDSIVNAIEAGKLLAQQQAAAGAPAAANPEKKPSNENRNVSTTKTSPAESSRQKAKEAEDDFARQLEAAQRGKK